jgi:hypothetical protein
MQVKLDCAAAAKLSTKSILKPKQLPVKPEARSVVVISDDDDLCDFKIPQLISRRQKKVHNTPVLPTLPTLSTLHDNLLHQKITTVQAIPNIPISVNSPNLSPCNNSFIDYEPICTSTQLLDNNFITIHIPSTLEDQQSKIINLSPSSPNNNPSTDTDIKPNNFKPISAASFLLPDEMCIEPKSFYTNDCISFETSFINQRISPTNVQADLFKDIPLPPFNDTAHLINELVLLDDIFESPMSPDDCSSALRAVPSIGADKYLYNAPFTSYPRVEVHHSPDCAKLCRCCRQTIDFTTLLTIPQHLPKGSQIMCAKCLLTFISRPRDPNLDFFYRNLF